jgi:hypothetical protein
MTFCCFLFIIRYNTRSLLERINIMITATRVEVSSLYLGLGYPKGYRSLSAEVFLDFNDKRYALEVFTNHYHQDEHRRGIITKSMENCLLCKSPNQLRRTAVHQPPEIVRKTNKKFEKRIDEAYCMLIDRDELGREDIEAYVRELMKMLNFENEILVAWPDNFDEEERQSWEKGHLQRLGWLRAGAPPASIQIDPHAFDSLSEASQERFRAKLEQAGFMERRDGSLYKSSDKIKDAPREMVEEKVLQIASLEEEHEGVYLSNGSWPPLSTVVAGGMRHRITLDEGVRRRYWMCYLQSKKLLLYLDPVTLIYESLQLQDDPDFLEAMQLIGAPR